MNKKFLAVAAVLCVSAGVTFTACNTQPEIPAHEHEYSAEWSYEDENHFHKCQCGDKQDITAHSFTESVVSEASCFKKGSKKLTCGCGYEKTEDIQTIEHSFGKDYESNSLQHWHECTVEGCEAEDTKVNHVWGDGEVTPPTLGEDGYTTYTCICGETKIEEGEHATGLATSFKLTDENGNEVTKVYSVLNKTISVNVTEVEPAAADIALYDDIKIYHNGEEVPTPDKADSTTVLTAFYNTEDKVITIRCNAIAEYELTVKTRLVTKTITVSPTAPEKMAVSINAYDAETDAYVWGNASNAIVYTGQSLEFKSAVAEGVNGEYTATVISDNAANAELSTANGITTFTATAAGDYAVQVTSKINAAAAITLNVTVLAAPDTAIIFSGSYEGGEYTLTFDDGGTLTVTKDTVSETLSYVYEDGAFTATHTAQPNSGIEVKLTPEYKLIIKDGEGVTALTKVVSQDAALEILGGTTWSYAFDDGFEYITLTVTFNEDGTGIFVKNYRSDWDDNDFARYYFEYSSVETGGGKYALTFTTGEIPSDAEDDGPISLFELGAATKGEKHSNDCSVVNKNSYVSVDGGNTALSLWLKTGDPYASGSKEQAVSFTLSV